MVQRILSDDQLDSTLLKDGYVVVPFLDADTVRELKAFFLENHPQGVNGFYATAHSADIPFRNRMNDGIKQAFERPISRYFIGCRALGGSFVVKSNTQKDRLHPHQDWNIVDEEKYRSFNIWVPLVDLNGRNGAIRVMPGSHGWVRNFRGPSIPDAFQQVQEEIWKRMVPLHMKAGQALIYDHRLFHASDPNLTDELRVAAVFGIIPDEAKMFYYFGRDGKVEVYESSVEFFMTGDIQKGPEILTKLKEVAQPEVEMPAFLADRSEDGKGLLSKLRTWLGTGERT
ncbi:MAG: phytanoyl-CoA dioxygenase family protein [Flavobacteriales bacterium]|nr:phytanoyl-CoA dioxygenase family protein [Flavobacteriales bacterium]